MRRRGSPGAQSQAHSPAQPHTSATIRLQYSTAHSTAAGVPTFLAQHHLWGHPSKGSNRSGGQLRQVRATLDVSGAHICRPTVEEG